MSSTGFEEVDGNVITWVDAIDSDGEDTGVAWGVAGREALLLRLQPFSISVHSVNKIQISRSFRVP